MSEKANKQLRVLLDIPNTRTLADEEPGGRLGIEGIGWNGKRSGTMIWGIVISFIVGFYIGILFMCILQINGKDEEKKK